MPETATPAGFLLCDLLCGLQRYRLACCRARRGAIFNAAFFWTRSISRFARFSSGRETKFHFIFDVQFFQGSRHYSIYTVAEDAQNLGKGNQKTSIVGDNFRAGVFLFVMEEKTRLASPAASVERGTRSKPDSEDAAAHTSRGWRTAGAAARHRIRARRGGDGRRGVTVFRRPGIVAGHGTERTRWNERNRRPRRYDGKGRPQRPLPVRQRPKV